MKLPLLLNKEYWRELKPAAFKYHLAEEIDIELWDCWRVNAEPPSILKLYWTAIKAILSGNRLSNSVYNGEQYTPSFTIERMVVGSIAV